MTKGEAKYYTDLRTKRLDYLEWLKKQQKITEKEIAEIEFQLKEPVTP